MNLIHVRNAVMLLIYLFWLYTLYEIARYLIGGSLSSDQLIVLGLGSILGMLFKVNGDVSGLRVEVSHVNRRLSLLEEDMDSVKSALPGRARWYVLSRPKKASRTSPLNP